MRLLILRLSALGDAVHALPTLEAIRAAHPDAYLGWLVESGAAPLVEGHPALDAVHVWPRRQWRRTGLGTLFSRSRDLFRSISNERYDAVLDLQGLLRSGLAARLCGAPRRIGFGGAESREGNRFFMTERHTIGPEILHIVDRNLALAARALGFVPPAQSKAPLPRFVPLPPVNRDACHLIEAARPLIVLNPGAGWAAKRWPTTRFAELAILLRQRWPTAHITVTLGPGEENLLAGIRDSLRSMNQQPDDLLRPLPILPLRELVALLRECDLMISGDTGPLHIAAAAGVACVGLYAEVPARRNGPYGDRVRVIERNVGHARRSAGATRHRAAPAEGFPIATITAAEAMEACVDLLG